MHEWIESLTDLLAAGEPAVMVTVAGVRGSAPREPGARMLVTREETTGTIGGGQLEFQCTRLAVDMLNADDGVTLRRFPLGAAMGQCCGGAVDVLFEPVTGELPQWLRTLRGLHGQRIDSCLLTGIADGTRCIVTADGPACGDAPAAGVEAARDLLATGGPARVDGDWFVAPLTGSDFNIAVFGAGHVGAAVVAALAGIDCNIRWVDSRRRIFRRVPANVRAVETESPALEVAALPPGSYFLVMTHSHAIDLDICARVLARNDAAYCGLIGSLPKRRRFEKRLQQLGVDAAALARLTCPIGVGGISGKKPAEIAVAVAAELLQARESALALPQSAEPVRDTNVVPLRS